MDKLCAGSRALAFLVAIVAAFATIPQLATILLVLGGVSALANKPEDNVRVYLVATVFTVGAKSLGGLIAVGSYLSAIFANVGTAAMGAAAVGASFAIVNLTRAAFMGASQPAMKPATA